MSRQVPGQPVGGRPAPTNGYRSFSSGEQRPPAQQGGYPPPGSGAGRQQPPQQYRYYVPPPPQSSSGGRGRGPGAASVALVSLLIVVFLFLLFVCLATAAYAAIAADLPSAEALRGRSATFISTRIYDRNGHLLYEIFDPTGGRRTLVPYEQISPHLINATVATEDERFWQHPGIDPIGILRAILQNVQEGEIVSGASTIPQTLVDNVFLTPEERFEQSLRCKIREAVLASEISRRYTKQEILEIYLNEVNFGNLAYGVEAAADTYFDKKASDLTLAEAALLAGLPQAPAYWDPHTNFERAKRRQAVVLDLMVQAGYISRPRQRRPRRRN